MITPEKFNEIFQEPDKERRDHIIDELTEEDAKDLLKSMGDFKHRHDKSFF